MTGQSHDYKRNGTTTLFAALERFREPERYRGLEHRSHHTSVSDECRFTNAVLMTGPGSRGLTCGTVSAGTGP
jgi:hypothetical protein